MADPAFKPFLYGGLEREERIRPFPVAPDQIADVLAAVREATCSVVAGREWLEKLKIESVTSLETRRPDV